MSVGPEIDSNPSPPPLLARLTLQIFLVGQRRWFTATYKQGILEEAKRCSRRASVWTLAVWMMRAGSCSCETVLSRISTLTLS